MRWSPAEAVEDPSRVDDVDASSELRRGERPQAQKGETGTTTPTRVGERQRALDQVARVAGRLPHRVFAANRTVQGLVRIGSEVMYELRVGMRRETNDDNRA